MIGVINNWRLTSVVKFIGVFDNINAIEWRIRLYLGPENRTGRAELHPDV